MSLTKLTQFSKLISDLADQPIMTADEIKSYYDSSPEELRVTVNQLIDDLESIADGSSGADNIGATAITGLSGETVQSLLENLKALVDTKTTKTGNHEGTWQNLSPSDFDSGQQAIDLQAVEDDLANHKSSTKVGAHLAKNINIEDTAGNFQATQVEGALSELFTSVSDGKTEIATAITETDNTLTPTGSDTFQQLADSIRSINTGRRWASGSGRANGDELIVTGLDFTPTFVLYSQNSNESRGVVTNHLDFMYQINLSMQSTSVHGSGSHAIQANGFALSGLFSVNDITDWIAIE